MQQDASLFKDLLWGMTEKELRTRYKRTLFGFLWIFLNPLIQMIVISLVFALFIKDPIPHYNFYLFIGLLLWNFFSLSLTKATPSVVYERDLIKKARFPRIVIPLSIILANFINFLLALVLFAAATMFLSTFSLARLPLLILGLSELLLLTCGLGFWTTAYNVRFRDINFFVQAILSIWFYATPIVYTMSVVPQNLLWLWQLNPLTSVVQLFQHTFLGTPTPELSIVWTNLAISLLVFLFGTLSFLSESKYFDDWV